MRTISLTPITAEAFAPFGTLITPPQSAGERRFLSDAVVADGAGLEPVFHTNRVAPAALPLTLDQMEMHPHAAQAFVPLEVARFVVAVAPAGADGAPDSQGLRAFLVPGQVGVIYHRATWHMGASVLDSVASFAVLMWRGRADDDVTAAIEPVSLALAQNGKGREVA